jgi:hemerythrin-like domain-containing protein
MLRDPSLVPLSRQHHDGLALCVYIRRACDQGRDDPAHWQAQMVRAWEGEIRPHFEAEEQVLFPRLAVVPELAPIVAELLQQHARLRAYFTGAAAGQLGKPELLDFAELLTRHIRLEENQLFEGCQRALPPPQLEAIGRELEAALAASGAAACGLHPRQLV